MRAVLTEAGTLPALEFDEPETASEVPGEAEQAYKVDCGLIVGSGLHIAEEFFPLQPSVLTAFENAVSAFDPAALQFYAGREEIFACSVALEVGEEERRNLLCKYSSSQKGMDVLALDYGRNYVFPEDTPPKRQKAHRCFLRKLDASDLLIMVLESKADAAYFRYKADIEDWYRRTQSPLDIENFETGERIERAKRIFSGILYSPENDMTENSPLPVFPRVPVEEGLRYLKAAVEREQRNDPVFKPGPLENLSPYDSERVETAYSLHLEQEKERLAKMKEARRDFGEYVKIVSEYKDNPDYMTPERWITIHNEFWNAYEAEDETTFALMEEHNISCSVSEYAVLLFRQTVQHLQQQGLDEIAAEQKAGDSPEVIEAALATMKTQSLFQTEVKKWYEARLTGQPAPLPALPRTPPLPDVFSTSTGPASQSLRRGVTGGESFWEEDHGAAALRTKPIQGQREEMYAVCRPKADPPLVNYFDAEGEAVISGYLKPAWEAVRQMGPDEADWFDLILARFLDGWQQRDRDKPGTWDVIRVEDLRRARTKDRSKSFQSPQEREQHHAALRRLLGMKLVWESASAQQGKPRAEMFDYFHFTEGGQPTFDGRWEGKFYRVFPTWWFDAEMLSSGDHTPMYFEAGLRAVLQIPPNKALAKAVARYLVGGFWRQRACDPRRSDGGRYTISLFQLFDRAGVAVPEWAPKRPGQFAERVENQLRHISGALGGGDGALLSMPTLTPPDGKAAAFARYLNQEVELRPHPAAPKALRDTIALLETQGKTQADHRRKVQMQANIRIAAEKKRATIAPPNANEAEITQN